MEAGAPGLTVLETDRGRAAGRRGCSARPAGDDGAAQPPGSPAPSVGGAHAALWSWGPGGDRCAQRRVPGPGRPRALSADCVGRGAYPRGPKRLPGESSGGRAALRRPGGLRLEAQGGGAGGGVGWGEVAIQEPASVLGHLSGLRGWSSTLLGPRGGPAQWVEGKQFSDLHLISSSRPPILGASEHPAETPRPRPVSSSERPGSDPSGRLDGALRAHQGCARPRNRAVRVRPQTQASLGSTGPSRLSDLLSLAPAPGIPTLRLDVPAGTGGPNTGSERLGAGILQCPNQPPHPHRHPHRLGEDRAPCVLPDFVNLLRIKSPIFLLEARWRVSATPLVLERGHWAPPSAHHPLPAPR